MKKRIKIDSSILSLIIILTGLLYRFPNLYSSSLGGDDFFDSIGLVVVLSGIFVRMCARGYKKEHSGKGAGLVIDGPYALARNPMYLGSFLMGAGFTLIVWPWWSVPFFAALFYLRFRTQIMKEEAHLQKLFGSTYDHYCRRTPRVFPTIKILRTHTFAQLFPLASSFNTKEKWGLAGWFALAVVLETFQEKVIFGIMDVRHTIGLFAMSAGVFAIGLWVLYWLSEKKR